MIICFYFFINVRNFFFSVNNISNVFRIFIIFDIVGFSDSIINIC